LTNWAKRKPTNNPGSPYNSALGLYQLRYLSQIPDAAALNTVGLAKENGFSGLSGFVNGLLRHPLMKTRLTLSAARKSS